jgi:hypothetical protein
MKTYRTLQQAPPQAARIEELEPVVIEIEVRPIGAERVRQLLGDDAQLALTNPGELTFRSFEVRQVVRGRGVWLEEVHEHGGYGPPIWVEDQEAAEYLEAGSSFGLPMRPNARVRIPRFWVGCEMCAQDRARRLRSAR